MNLRQFNKTLKQDTWTNRRRPVVNAFYFKDNFCKQYNKLSCNIFKRTGVI